MAYIGKSPAVAALTASDITDGIVSNAKLAQDIISADTALGAAPADTDEFLVSDAGVLKRMDYSYIKGGGITMADSWRITANKTVSSGVSDITANWERVDTGGFGTIGSALTESSGIFTFPSTGIYLMIAQTSMSSGAALAYAGVMINTTPDNSTYGVVAATYSTTSTSGSNLSSNSSFIFDVTDTTNDKFKLSVQNSASCNYEGSTGSTLTAVSVIRLGDT